MITKKIEIPELSQIELGTQLEDAQAMFEQGPKNIIRVRFILDKKRIVAIKIINFLSFISLMIVAGVLFFFFKGKDIFSQDQITKKRQYNPFILLYHIEIFSWVAILFMFLLFSTMPLVYNRDNYDLLLFEKIKYKYAGLCLMMAAFSVVYASGQNLSKIWITPVVAFLVKCYDYFFIYTRIKYHDDGHDYVSRLQFVCLHLTFSMSSAWLTYITVFCLFNSISQDSTTDAYFLNWNILDWQKLFQILIFCQASINLAYYKDVFFSLIVSAVFLGQFLRGQSLNQKNKEFMQQCQNDPICNSSQYFKGSNSEKLAFGLFIVLIIFIILTVLTNFRSVIYIKYSLLMQKLRVMQNKGLIKSKQRAADRAQITPLDPNLMKNAPDVIMGSIFTSPRINLKQKQDQGGRRKKIVLKRRNLHSYPFQKSVETVESHDSFEIGHQSIDINKIQQQQMARFDQLEPVQELNNDSEFYGEGIVQIEEIQKLNQFDYNNDNKSQCSLRRFTVQRKNNNQKPNQASEQVKHYFSFSSSTVFGEDQSLGINLKATDYYMYYRINNSDQLTDSYKSNFPADQNNNINDMTTQIQQTEQEEECQVPIELFKNGIYQCQDTDDLMGINSPVIRNRKQKKSIKRKYTNKTTEKKIR